MKKTKKKELAELKIPISHFLALYTPFTMSQDPCFANHGQVRAEGIFCFAPPLVTIGLVGDAALEKTGERYRA